MRGKRKYPTVPGIFIRIAAVTISAALVLSYISTFIKPSSSGIIHFFGLFFIPFLLTSAIIEILLIISRSRLLWVPLIAMIPSLFYVNLFFRPGKGSTATGKTEDEISLLSYNIGMLSSSESNLTRNQCLDSINSFIREMDFDIVCLQEFYSEDPENAENDFPEYEYSKKHMFRMKKNGHGFGNIILSRYPITGSGVISFDRSTNLSIYADILIGKDTIRVYDNHLESYNISFTSMVKKSVNREKLASELTEMTEKMQKSFSRRTSQVDTIVNNAQNSRYPSFVCGDFNDTPMSYTYRKLKEGRKDSFREAGTGFSATYSQFWPMLRIDYILVPENATVTMHITERNGFSDHYPIHIKFKI